MSYREKAAWMSLVTTLAVWSFYVIRLVERFRDGNVDAGDFIGLFIGITILLVIVQILLAIALALLSPRGARTPTEEREKLISLKATQVASVVMTVLVMTVVLASPFVAGASPHVFPKDPTACAVFLMANGVLLSVAVGEIVRDLGQIYLFRRMA